ncbi:MAG: amidohydrolase family protein [Lentisphaeria bacterium]|nr:amidohydrolase family protein [Lentisphaeria bacterium]
MHCHTAGIGSNSECFISDELRKSWKINFYFKSFNSSIEELEEKGDQILLKHISDYLKESKYLDGVVILAMDGVITDGKLDKEQTEIYVPSDYVARETKKYANLYYGASINPNRPDAIERMRQAKKDGAVLMKWLPSVMFFDPSDEKYIPFYEELIKLDIPLLTHAGHERSFTLAKNELADPKKLLLPLKLGVTVIAAHIGCSGKNDGQDNMQRLIEMMDDYPNLYADISSLTQLNKLGFMSEALRTESLKGRLLYGTDFPLIETGLTHPIFHAFNLTASEIQEIQAHKNPFDQDIILKQKLGLSPDVFSRSAKLLKLD